MSKPTLSVIIANYNHASHIGKALDAILSQGFLPAEVIVIDDGSTDNSMEVIEGFRRKHGVITLLENHTNKGVTFSNSRGLATASGDYVYFASADDMVLPGFFEKSVDLLCQYPHAGLCHTELKAYDGREYKSYLSEQPRYFSIDELTMKSKQRGYFYASGINSIIRRDVFLQSGGIVAQTGPLWDLFAAMTVGIRHGLCYIPEPLVAIRTVENSYSGAVKRQGAQMRRLLENILLLLNTPAYQDLSEWVEETGVWPKCFPSMLYVLLKDRRRWRYLSPGLVQRALWVGVRNMLGRVVPLTGKKLYFRMSNGYRKIASAWA